MSKQCTVGLSLLLLVTAAWACGGGDGESNTATPEATPNVTAQDQTPIGAPQEVAPPADARQYLRQFEGKETTRKRCAFDEATGHDVRTLRA